MKLYQLSGINKIKFYETVFVFVLNGLKLQLDINDELHLFKQPDNERIFYKNRK